MTHNHSHENTMVHDHRDINGGTVRAAIFGISDGLVSNSALILGIAAANLASDTVFLAGLSGLLAGATSMAAGEYLSMKAQNELIERELKVEEESLTNNPQSEIKELQAIYMSRGLSNDEAKLLAETIHRNPQIALEVHAREELGIDPHNIGSPSSAAVSSFSAFTFGALIPLLPWTLFDGDIAIFTSLFLAIATAAIVGIVLAKFTERSILKTAFRQVAVAVLACAMTIAVGTIFGT